MSAALQTLRNCISVSTVPLAVIQSGSMDELNYLGKLLEMQRDEDKAKFAAAVTLGDYAGKLKDIINLAQNLDCYWLYPSVHSEEDYGYYLIDELDESELPEEVKKYFMYEEYGRDAAINDGGRFTEKGYTTIQPQHLYRVVQRARRSTKEYRVTPQPPQRSRPDPEKVEMDAAAPGQRTAQTAEQPQEPRPVIPIVLTSEKPAEKLKEITDRLEQGITELSTASVTRNICASCQNSIITASKTPSLSPCRSRTLPLWRAFPLGRITLSET